MALRLVQVNFNAGDDAELGGFWTDAGGGGLDSEAPDITDLQPVRFEA
ncbi:hypothetical protein [Actinomadura gamaensis]|uniref:Uncharacterized protein n=1 Tax=Actinomadura gamaensis TaxID=1763541 RepID=A0ABV9U7U2_9ACTN